MEGEERSLGGCWSGVGAGAGEGEEGERHERHEARSAACCEWLKTRSDKRIRSNLRGGSATASAFLSASRSASGGEPHVKPCVGEQAGQRLREEQGDRAETRLGARVSDVGRVERRDVEVDVALEVAHEGRVGEV